MLNKFDIKKYMLREEYAERLIVTPLLSENQIGPASIDIRIGSSIIIPKRAYLETQDVTDESIAHQVEARRYEKARLRYHTKFMLHPTQMILAGTFEYLCLPCDLFAMILSRSSWGRLGLIVATAAAVQPGYKGSLTLELVNVSESPIALYPGLPVGQLVFHEIKATGESELEAGRYGGRYSCPTEAELPRFFEDEADQELRFWGSGGLGTKEQA